jgi:C4-dicarboxylate transporter
VNDTVFLHLNERLNENKVNEYYTIVNFNKVIQLSTLKGAAENYCTMQVNHNMVIKIFWL